MINRVEQWINESRANLRVKENKRIAWEIKNSELKGFGRVRNISATGMLIETSSDFLPESRSEFSFDASLGHDNFIPQKGKLVWHRRNGTNSKNLCGIHFVEPAEYVLTKLHRHVKTRIDFFTHQKKVTVFSNAVLVMLMLGLSGYVLWTSSTIYQDMYMTNHQVLTTANQQAALTQNYSELYTEYSRLYAESELMLANVTTELQNNQTLLSGVTTELEATKEILASTEILLTQAQTANENLKSELISEVQTMSDAHIIELQTLRTELTHTIALLEEQNVSLSNELKSVQDQLTYYKGNINSIDEGKGLLLEYNQTIKDVKLKIKHFYKQARDVRRTALKEQDRIRMLLGNNGYFVQNGETVKVDMQKYKSATMTSADSLRPTPVKNNVKIDVTIFD